MPFVKLDCGIVDSTVFLSPPDVLKVWIWLLAKAGPDGVVNFAVPALAKQCGIELNRALEILSVLESPEEYSRSQDADGRRLKKLNGVGYLLVNYLRYRSTTGRIDDSTGAGVGGNPVKFSSLGYVYFIRSGHAIKIGFSRNPWARLRSLKTGMAENPEILGVIKGTLQLESELHARFEHLSTTGEWFRDDPELLHYISLVATRSNTTSSYRSTEAEAEAEAEVDLEKKREDSSEPERPATEPAPVLVFKTVGKEPEFGLQRAKILEWHDAFPTLEIYQQCLKAQAWIEANPTRRKTARGMPRFLYAWLARAQNGARP